MNIRKSFGFHPALLFMKPVDDEVIKVIQELLNIVEERAYSDFNSYTATVASWRVLKPVYNRDICKDCQNCWVWCPDTSIVSRDKQMLGIDYDHCKGCGVCVEVCPTNPKSLLMFGEATNNDDALASWPEKKKKAKK